jgi:hypothetical protein
MKKITFQLTEKTYFALEFAPRGELFDFLVGAGQFPEPIARVYFS